MNVEKVREEEEEALRLLKKYFPEYQGLELKDKPDLIDWKNSIGVEVTRALNPCVKEREVHFVNKMKDKRRDEFTSQDMAKLERFGLSIVCDDHSMEEKIVGLVRVFGMEEHDQLHIAIRKKYEIQIQYAQLDRIDLYIYFRHVFREGFAASELDRLFDTIYQCQEKHGKVFRKIMIDFYSVLLVLDVERGSVEEIKNYGE